MISLLYGSLLYATDNTVYLAQKKLLYKGYDPGPVDGVPGEKTRRAVADFQWDIGLSVTGELNRLTKKALGILVYGQTQIGAANLKLFHVPVQEWDSHQLLSKINQLNVKFDTSKDLIMYTIDGVGVHTGQITRIIRNDCIKPYENSIGEIYLRGRSIRSSKFGDIFTSDVASKLNQIHNKRAYTALRKSNEEAVFICTAAMF
ncbi:MAG: peptidoglycan-binding protein [Gammaproteobacteria bacterium]|nr:peptidoglycan-binding protein [Gammaproteobacteria bacterium]